MCFVVVPALVSVAFRFHPYSPAGCDLPVWSHLFATRPQFRKKLMYPGVPDRAGDHRFWVWLNLPYENAAKNANNVWTGISPSSLDKKCSNFKHVQIQYVLVPGWNIRTILLQLCTLNSVASWKKSLLGYKISNLDSTSLVPVATLFGIKLGHRRSQL